MAKEKPKRRARAMEEVKMPKELPAPKGVLPVVRVSGTGFGVEGKKLAIRVTTTRRQAAVDYITDPDSRSVEFHYNRDDRDYTKVVTLDTFREWATADGWLDRRSQWFADLEKRLLEELQDRHLVARLKEIGEMSEIRGYMMEYMKPLRDKDGNVLRDEETNLPKFPLALPEFDKFVGAVLKLDERLMLKRGESIVRAESITKNVTKTTTTTALDPVADPTLISPEDVKTMARMLLARRQPEIADYLEAKASGEDEDEEEEPDGRKGKAGGGKTGGDSI